MTIINALLYVVENGCKWRALPEKYGPWHTVYMRFSRWVKNGVIDKVFNALHGEFSVTIDKKVLSLDSACVKAHPDGTGCQKKNGPQSIGKTRGGKNTKIHTIVANEKAVSFFIFHEAI